MFKTRVVVKRLSPDKYKAVALNTMQCATGFSEKDALKELEIKLRDSNFSITPLPYLCMYLLAVVTFNLFSIKAHTIWYELEDE